jgi:hypothetical protein
MTREDLRAGYIQIMRALYEAGAYFNRVDDLLLSPEFQVGRAQEAYLARHPWRRVKSYDLNAIRAVAIYYRLRQGVEEDALRDEYRLHMARAWRVRRDPFYSFVYACKCVFHYHYHSMIKEMGQRERMLVNTF